jgi:hydrogenase maturation protein HypF
MVPASVAARFHRGLAGGIVELVGKIVELRGFDTVAPLSGGCFQNAVLFGEVSRLLRKQGYNVLSMPQSPPKTECWPSARRLSRPRD